LFYNITYQWNPHLGPTTPFTLTSQLQDVRVRGWQKKTKMRKGAYEAQYEEIIPLIFYSAI
jgi:hypothetical protein